MPSIARTTATLCRRRLMPFGQDLQHLGRDGRAPLRLVPDRHWPAPCERVPPTGMGSDPPVERIPWTSSPHRRRGGCWRRSVACSPDRRCAASRPSPPAFSWRPDSAPSPRRALRAVGKGGEAGFSGFHRVLNAARWGALEGARLLLLLIVGAFVPEGPVVIGLDDTIERRKGPRITAKGDLPGPGALEQGLLRQGLRAARAVAHGPRPGAVR